MKPDHEPLASRALSALADRCEIPADVEERILSAVLDGAPPPIVPLPRARPEAELFENVIRSSRQEQRRWRWLGWTMAAATCAVVALVIAHRPSGPSRAALPALAVSPGRVPPPAGVRGEELLEGDPRLGEARKVMFLVTDKVAAECKVASWSADVLFEETGHATVLGVSSSGPDEEACVRRVVSEARARPQPGQRVAIRWEIGAEARGSGAARQRIFGWLVDDA